LRSIHNCKLCGKGYINRARLFKHTQLHEKEPPWKCIICKTDQPAFNDSDSLKQHVSTVHPGDEPIDSCEICGRGFQSKSHKRQHVRQVHEDKKDKPVPPCQYCGTEFSDHKERFDHMKTHDGPKVWSCLICNMNFASKRMRVRHHQAKHEDNSYPCPVCGKTFKTQMDTYLHKRQQHGTAKNSTPAKFLGMTLYSCFILKSFEKTHNH